MNYSTASRSSSEIEAEAARLQTAGLSQIAAHHQARANIRNNMTPDTTPEQSAETWREIKRLTDAGVRFDIAVTEATRTVTNRRTEAQIRELQDAARRNTQVLEVPK